MEEGLMVQCGVPLLGYHPLISITIIRAIKLLVPVKESRKHLLLQRVQLCLNLRRERWLKFLLGHSRKQVQQLLPVSLLKAGRQNPQTQTVQLQAAKRVESFARLT
jgi:hypothetical protein